jgi:Na+-transporting NADH:ubiquinone oxidoreductase subunit NqrB
MTEERRKTRRVPASIACIMRDAEGQEQPFDLVDLSESGARLTCANAIAAMTRIHVRVELPAARVGRVADARVETLGVVVWSHQVEDAVYDTGVFFPELAPEHLSLLQAYVLSAV